MLQYATIAGGWIYAYYKCRRLVRKGKDDCWPDRFRTNHCAEEVERRVWEFAWRAGVVGANLAKVLSGRREPSPMMLAKLEAALQTRL